MEKGKPVVASGGCTTPVVSNFQGGLVTRGLARQQVNLTTNNERRAASAGSKAAR